MLQYETFISAEVLEIQLQDDWAEQVIVKDGRKLKRYCKASAVYAVKPKLGD